VTARTVMLRVRPADLERWRAYAARYAYADEYALIRAAVDQFVMSPGDQFRDARLGAAVRQAVADLSVGPSDQR